MKQIPRKIVILGQCYKVVVKLNATDGDAGEFCDKTNTIFIEKKQSKEDQIKTFWHEFFHALQHRNGTFQGLPESLLEVLAETSATAVYEFLKTVKK